MMTTDSYSQQIFRSKEYASIAGVCAGIAISKGWSITLVRMVTLALVSITGLGLFLYLLAWIFIPAQANAVALKNGSYLDKDPLRRSRQNKILGGVCGGLAEYFKVDLALMRILFCFLILCVGVGLLPYIYAWIVLPPKAE